MLALLVLFFVVLSVIIAVGVSFSRPPRLSSKLLHERKSRVNEHTRTVLTGIDKPLDRNNDCNNILLLLQDSFAFHGIASQLNGYVLATIVSFLTNRSLVGISNFHANDVGKSQFGCPSGNRALDDTRFPSGLSRLIKIPEWLSGGFSNPCTGSHSYDDLLKISLNEALHNITCTDGAGRNVSVLPLDFWGLRKHFLFAKNISYSELYSRIGATASEISWILPKGKLQQQNKELWDLLVSLLNRRGLISFQPWINKDVDLRLKQINLPKPYIALHIRRGDKLLEEAKHDVGDYWGKRGYDESTQPTNYIPFHYYMEQLKDDKNITTVYVATDDPITVKGEIANFANMQGYNFVLFPDQSSSTGHILTSNNCQERYRKTIAAVTDLMILFNSDIFIGEFNSNWGRFLRTWRTSFVNDTIGVVLTRDTYSAFGSWRPPGW